MNYKHIYEPTALNEYKEAVIWYKEKSVIAAENLVSAVEEGIRAICIDPHRYRNTHKNLRELTLKKYPYNLLYLVNDDKKIITIVSLFHHRRNPEKKYKK